jgi:hypothetical protein
MNVFVNKRCYVYTSSPEKGAPPSSNDLHTVIVPQSFLLHFKLKNRGEGMRFLREFQQHNDEWARGNSCC